MNSLKDTSRSINSDIIDNYMTYFCKIKNNNI